MIMDQSFNANCLFQKFSMLFRSEQTFIYLYTTTILIILHSYIRYRTKRRQLEKITSQFDGPKGLPFFGSVLQFTGSTKDALQALLKVMTTYNSSFKMWVFHKPVIFLTDPEDFRIAAIEILEKDSHHKFFEEIIGDTIFTAKGERWKKTRRIFSPALNPNILLEYFLQIFNQQNVTLINELKKEVGTGEHFEMLPYIRQTTLKTILESAMGYKVGDDTTEMIKFEDALSKTLQLLLLRCHKPWLMPSFMFKTYCYLMGYENVFKTLRELPLKALKRQRELLHRLKSETNVSTEQEKTMRNFISNLLNAHEEGNHFTDEDMVNEVINIIFAGYDAKSFTICFCLLMLAIRQDIQDKVYEEIRQVFGDSDRLPEAEDLNKLSYLEQCIRETLRKYPPIILIARCSKHDIPISNGKIIPAGCSVVLSIYGVHHNPEIYSNPEIWDPTNFSPEKIASRHKSSFVAFSSGPRDCIGYKYGMLSMKAQICLLIRNFRITTDFKMQDIELDVGPMLRSANGYPIKLEYRQ
ncbi:cytochrome P450 4g15-like [Planococcus citri]|uniref:cytochrome P450 4g15-like n=1 Tax=Planococcus citri TaxID=170843 RepID=UPI0031F76CEC